jgi:membrane protease YdiL (CAAX protease family)
LTARAVLRSADGRLRALWRLLIFGALVLLFAVLAQGFVLVLFPALGQSEVISAADVVGAPAITFYWLLVLAFLGAHAVVLRFVEHRSWDFVWMGRGAARPGALATGLLIGTLAVGVPSAILLGIGWLDVTDAPGTWMAHVLALSMFLLPAAFVEELMMRGYLLAVLREALGARSALLFTSIAFGVLHAYNANASARALVLVSIAGIFLGVIVLEKQSLFAATTAHFAWNATLAILLRTAVSGEELPGGDYRVIDDGPDWATGGAWGPEGGAGAMAGMLVATAVLLRRALALRAERSAAS